MLKTRKVLKELYAAKLKPVAMRQRKAEVLQKLKTKILKLHSEDPEYSGLSRWAKRPINNANLAAIAVYYRQVPAFDRILVGRGGNLEEYFSEVELISRLSKEERMEKMQSLVADE